MIYYSATNKTFYSDEVVPKNHMPSDVFEVDDNQHKEMIYQLNMRGKDIIVSDSNKIIYVDRQIKQTWTNIRAKRNQLLAASDHKVMPDYPSDKKAWTAYRQALRDITKTFTDPNEVVWPIEPK